MTQYKAVKDASILASTQLSILKQVAEKKKDNAMTISNTERRMLDGTQTAWWFARQTRPAHLIDHNLSNDKHVHCTCGWDGDTIFDWSCHATATAKAVDKP